MKREFKGIWMPAKIYLNPELSWTEKILIVEIDSLQGEDGCFASNGYLADFLGVTVGSMANIISSLAKREYLEVVLKNNNERRLFTLLEGKSQNFTLHKKMKGGVHKKMKGGFIKI